MLFTQFQDIDKRTNYKTLRLILGDQLNAAHSWYKNKDKQTLYLLVELRQETDYVKHHVQKICAFFAAMQSFAEGLAKAGHSVLYLNLDESQNYGDLSKLILELVSELKVECFEYQSPDEYRLAQQLKQLTLASDIELTECSSEHFIVPKEDLPQYFEKDKSLLMESFYRKLRKKHNILMTDQGKPVGGQWNFDHDNRNKLKKQDLKEVPDPLLFANDVSGILKRLQRHQVKYFGDEAESLLWPRSRKQSLDLLKFFCQHLLPNFGRFQDAMTDQIDSKWSLYHSRLSFSLNSKMLHPMQVIEAALEEQKARPEEISLAQLEGFIRQILGWREFVRGIYWANMPDYAHRNALRAQRNLPSYFWSANTKMQCMSQAIAQSLNYSYAHHIQRLMVTGNFCLLTGIDPNQVDAWYLGIYVDAIEWVEMPNTRGMSQFADGGILASKPYAASGNYIKKMSDYCSGCQYKVKEKLGEDACPFNSLYWRFMLKHRDKQEKNPRVGMLYKGWDKRDESEKNEILDRAEWCLNNIESL